MTSSGPGSAMQTSSARLIGSRSSQGSALGTSLAGSAAVRVFSDSELSRLSTECRGFLMTLERLGVLSPPQREIVVDRMLALDADELDTEQLKWVVLMVLSSQPDQEQAFARMEDFVLDSSARARH